MIPTQNIVAWGNLVPWTDPRQIEQDLIISRALVEIFSDPMLREALRFRGGTALNKLHFPAPLRYSEDIDLVRTSHGPIGPLLDQLRVVLEPWLGRAQFDHSPVAPKFRFGVEAEDGSGVPIRLKIEINTREVEAFDAPTALPLEVVNPWFCGRTTISTFSREEMLATKLRALLQRNKGRDLYDLAHALEVFEGLDTKRIVEMFGQYLRGHQRRTARRNPRLNHAVPVRRWLACQSASRRPRGRQSGERDAQTNHRLQAHRRRTLHLQGRGTLRVLGGRAGSDDASATLRRRSRVPAGWRAVDSRAA